MGLIQNEDVKTLAELTTAGGSVSQLINDTKIYVTGAGLNDQLSTLITNGSIGGGGSGGVNWTLPDGNSPLEAWDGGVSFYDFDSASTPGQEIWCMLTVPFNYTAGTRIYLKNGSYICSETTGNVKFKATTYLIEDGTTVHGTFSNSHASANTETTVPASANQYKAIGDIDLCAAGGTINSVAIAGGDKLLVKLIRDIVGETTPVTTARLVKSSMIPKFTP